MDEEMRAPEDIVAHNLFLPTARPFTAAKAVDLHVCSFAIGSCQFHFHPCDIFSMLLLWLLLPLYFPRLLALSFSKLNTFFF
jgi:hypothetical protein